MADDLQPIPADTDYLTLFGLPGAAFETQQLDSAFYALSRRYHPDFYSTRSPEEQAISLENTAILNNAYQTLRDPFARAKYLIEQFEGAEGAAIDAKPPQALFMQVLEINEQLETLQEAKADGDTAQQESMRRELTAAREELTETNDALEGHLRTLFLIWDAGEEKSILVARMRDLLGARKYLARVLNNIRAELER